MTDGWRGVKLSPYHMWSRIQTRSSLRAVGAAKDRVSYGSHLWLRKWMHHLHAQGSVTLPLPAAFRHTGVPSPPCCHVVWLWLDLKTESLWLIKNKYTAAHAGSPPTHTQTHTHTHTHLSAREAGTAFTSQIVPTQRPSVFGADLASAVWFLLHRCACTWPETSPAPPPPPPPPPTPPAVWSPTQSFSPELTTFQMTLPPL